MKRLWKGLFKSSSPNNKSNNRGPEQQQQQQQQRSPQGPKNVPPSTVSVENSSLYTNGNGATSQAANIAPTNHLSYNDQGHRVITRTVRVPAPPPRPPSPPPKPSSAPHLLQPSSTIAGAMKQATTSEADKRQATTDITRMLVKKFIADIWNRGEIDMIPEVCSPNLRFNGNSGFDRIGHDGLARMVATIREALDDYHCEIHSMVVEHNKAFCRLRFTGKHAGHLLGYEPTHRIVAWMGATEFTCQNGKILKVWELGDVKSLEDQLQPDDAARGKNVPHHDEDEI